MQYTLRDIPGELDKALREGSRRVHKSLNQFVIETLMKGARVDGTKVRYSDLDNFFGKFVEDPQFDEALKSQRQIDEDMWK